MKRAITLVGCDNSVSVVLEVSTDEMRFLERLQGKIDETRNSGCQPIIEIGEAE